ncbi:hypothetical protein FGO68_gene7378 [Halteria grandinella]|uniref:Uncharacterized protein n=1 Tax=Halteria grandinella TaxID=5974 RepID=A0A8J8T4R6_HALGN|nr:hypothetical protein FGO68_gene7378 [Halteria grandinella]
MMRHPDVQQLAQMGRSLAYYSQMGVPVYQGFALLCVLLKFTYDRTLIFLHHQDIQQQAFPLALVISTMVLFQ